MSAHNPKLLEQQRELEAVKARLARQERMTGVAGIAAIVLALTLSIECLLEGEWPLESLLRLIP
jgi:hypothetical protein